MGIHEVIAQNIMKLRKAAGFSQLDLAVRAEITTGMLLDFEHARGNPNTATLSKLANALGVPLHALFEGIEGQTLLPNPMAEMLNLLNKLLE